MSHEAQARAGPADYQPSHLMHTMAQHHVKAGRPKNQSIDVGGSHALHYQQYASNQGHLAEHHRQQTVGGHSTAHPSDPTMLGAHTSSLPQHAQPGHHAHQMSLQIHSQATF